MINDKSQAIIEMESFLNTMPDIISSRIVTGNNDEIEEIHIVAYAGRSPKQISRDVQSALMATYNIQIDYKIISVAQINSSNSLSKEYRFLISGISFSQIGKNVEIRVRLKKEDKEIEAMFQGPNTTRNIHRLIVQATLECVHSFLGCKNLFIVEDIVYVNIAKEEAIAIAITYMSSYHDELLIGSALLKKDHYDAVVKATLDAINRKVIHVTSN